MLISATNKVQLIMSFIKLLTLQSGPKWQNQPIDQKLNRNIYLGFYIFIVVLLMFAYIIRVCCL